jgi:glucose/arabinose dehydrogenase
MKSNEMKPSTIHRLETIALICLLDAAVIAGISAITLNHFNQDENNQIQAGVEATVSADNAALARKPPVLTSPNANAVFDNAAAVILNWTWDRPLTEDEYFDLRVWHEGDPANGITWTKDSSFNLRDWLLYQKPGDFDWTVGVVEGDEVGNNKEITDLAPQQQFTMSAIDLKVMSLPPGFTAHYYARLPFKQPTVITFGPDGALYALSVEGDVARMTDTDGDGFAETITPIYTDAANQLEHAVGMAFHDGTLYVSDGGRISTLTDTNGDGTLDTIKPIVTGLPSQWYPFHSNNGIAFGSDGKLYVGVGSTTDHGPIRTPNEASILRMNPDGSDLETFATGFRNPYDLTFSPQGDLFTADNSPDAIDAALPYLPPEEVDHVQQGKNYGFPTVFGFPPPGSDVAPPVVDLFTSSASSGITYQDNPAFPPEYRGLYLAQFGTGADYPLASGLHTGQQVVFISLTPDGHGSFTGTWKPFATFRSDLQDSYTPIDVTVGPEGALYIAEWTSATVFRVTYSESDATAEAPAATESPEAVGEAIFRNGVNDAPACVTCHSLDPNNDTIAPSLVGLSKRAASRVAGLSADDYVHQSILTPDAFIVPGFSGGVMYPKYAQQLTPGQVDALAAYVLSL